MKRLLTILLFGTLLASVTGANETERGNVGSISFPSSASGEAQAHFLRGVSILHSFGWKQARLEFQAAQKIDPNFALAYWGESLCYNHPLISEWDRETPTAILSKLGKNLKERLSKAPTEREKGFIRAVDALFFGDGDTQVRRTAYMHVMRAMHKQYPQDDEIAAFYALSLLMSAGPAGDGSHRSNILAGSIAMGITARNPNHPGAVHYTIHAFDDPVHAPLALPAAYVFADIAAAVSHARHMPTHIFIQHGLWDLVASQNQSAYDAALALYEPGDKVGDMVHALDWGQYGELQRGDIERARLWISRMEKILQKAPEQPRAQGTYNNVRARIIIETGDWLVSAVTAESSGPELLATGLSAVKLNELEVAQQAADRLGELAAEMASQNKDSSYYSQSNKMLVIMQKEVAGVLTIARGDQEAGLAILKSAVELTETMRPPNGAPNPLKPPHELYAEALLEAGNVSQALDAYNSSLARTANRTLSLAGAARAHKALGNKIAARENYQKLAAILGERDIPLSAEVRSETGS